MLPYTTGSRQAGRQVPPPAACLCIDIPLAARCLPCSLIDGLTSVAVLPCLLRLLCRYGFQPQRVAFWIYWHALLLLWKGVPFYSPPGDSFQVRDSVVPAFFARAPLCSLPSDSLEVRDCAAPSSASSCLCPKENVGAA
jgi:hypothetical protein